jgi:hypothetical protein
VRADTGERDVVSAEIGERDVVRADCLVRAM